MGTQDGGNRTRIDTAALLAKIDLVELVQGYLPELKKKGKDYVACCPFHGDRTPSFAVVPAKQFYHCHGCGAHGDAIDFVVAMDRVDFLTACETLGADKRTATPRQSLAKAAAEPERVTRAPPPGEPLPDMRLRTLGAPVRSWEYRDAAGALLGLVARYEYRNAEGEAKKEIRQWTWGSRDGKTWRWDCLHWAKPRPLYGLDRMAARPEAPILFSEGEKATDAAAILGAYVNAGWPGGTQAVKHVDWSPVKGRRLLLWPDFDTQTFKEGHPWVRAGRAAVGQVMPARLQPGYLAMVEVATLAHAAGATQIILIVPRDDDEKRDGWDLADAVAEGMSRKDIENFARARKIVWAPAPTTCGCGATLTAEEIEYYGGTCERCETQAHEEFSRSNSADADTQPGALGSDGKGVMQSERERGSADAPGATSGTRPAGNPPPAGRRFPIVGGTDMDGSAARDLAPRRDISASALPPEYSDDAVSAVFTEKHADDLRYVSAWGKWVRWTGQRWQRDDTMEAQDLARTVCREMARDAAQNGTLPPAQQRSVPKSLASKSMRDNVLSLACTHRAHASSPDRWDANPWVLNTPGGMVDLQTGQMRPTRPDDHAMKITRAAPGGECPEWLAFLDVVTGGDVELQRFMQRVAGYALTGSVREHALFFFHGSGGNGKGVFLNTLLWILGDYGQTAPVSEFMESKNEQHATGTADMAGARLVVADETDEGRRWAEDKVKRLTGGGPIKARFMGKDFFEFQPQFKLLISGNNRPEIRNVDQAMRRRFNLVPFDVTVENPDVNLPERLKQESAGILAWAVQGCLDWQAGGLRAPDRVRFATDEYLASQDSFSDWLLECTERDPLSQQSASELYKSFKTWAFHRNEPELTQKRFGEKLNGHKMAKSRDSRGGWNYHGIKLRAPVFRRGGPDMYDD